MQFSSHQAGMTGISAPLACFLCEILRPCWTCWLVFLRMGSGKFCSVFFWILLVAMGFEHWEVKFGKNMGVFFWLFCSWQWIILASLTNVCFVQAKGLIRDLSANSSNIAFEVPLASKWWWQSGLISHKDSQLRNMPFTNLKKARIWQWIIMASLAY